MTPEELDIARAREAHKRTFPVHAWVTGAGHEESLIEAARLARTGWTPVDPLLIEAREIVAKWIDANPNKLKMLASGVRYGAFDADPSVEQALAALRRGKELAGGGE